MGGADRIEVGALGETEGVLSIMVVPVVNEPDAETVLGFEVLYVRSRDRFRRGPHEVMSIHEVRHGHPSMVAAKARHNRRHQP
jgi:hypothetical protein